MRPSSCRLPRALGALLALAMTALASSAQAQACCAGAGVFAPARLKLGEDALVSLGARGHAVLGSLDAHGHALSAPPGTRELDLQQDLVGVVRVLGSLQLGLDLPLVQTHRAVPGVGEWGGGVGDVGFTARLELVAPNTHAVLPGIALLGGATLPTGTAPDAAHHPLATDATGLGAAQATAGVDLERAFGRLIVDGSFGLTQRFERQVGLVRERLGLQETGFLGVGVVPRGELAFVLFGSVAHEEDAAFDGARLPDSGRLLSTVGLSAGIPFHAGWRLQARAYEDLPLLGQNQLSGPGLSAAVIHAW